MSETAPIPTNDEEIARPIAAYLAACGLPPAHADKLARTHAGAALARGLPPARVLEELQARIDRWASPYGAWYREESPRHRAARGRARIFLAGLPVQRPELFLDPALPPDARTAISKVPLHATPDLHQTTSMVPQPLDLGRVSGMAEGTWRTFDTWPVLRGLTVWFLFFALLSVGFYTVRY